MFHYLWPLVLVVVSNILYQICAKSVPEAMDPFASLTVTYFVGTVFSFILYFAMSKKANILAEYSKLNAAPFFLGVVLVGLEVGVLFAYKNGWQVSAFSTVMSVFLAVALIFVGWILYHESISWSKVLGVGIVLVGLYFINRK